MILIFTEHFSSLQETGLPLEVAVRMQINMALDDVSPISRCGRFKNMVLPLLWTEIVSIINIFYSVVTNTDSLN